MNNESLISKEEYTFYENKNIWSKSKERFLKGYVHPKGYVQVWLKCTDGKIREFLWHRVIWFAFNGEIPDGYQINHIDENKQNNTLSNLNLMTPKENTNWGTHNERMVVSKSKPVVAVDIDDNVVYEFASTSEAGRNGFDQGNVAKCCRGERRTCGGYQWFFKSDWLKMKNAVPHKRETA